MNSNTKFFITIFIFVSLLVYISSETYNKGYYDGLKEFCKQGVLVYTQEGEIACNSLKKDTEVIYFDNYQT